jgi:hypothetical protein
MKVRVFFHDRCFDGAASASLFARFYRQRIRADAEFRFTGLAHRAGALFNEDDFDGDENAIVDFKYSASPRITWWFDHHESAFLSPADAEHYERSQSNKKFYDPDFRSCTKFLAATTEQRFGFDPRPVAELIRWADIIDGALYPDARTAVEMAEPAMRLTMAIETAPDAAFIPRLIGLLAWQPLDEIASLPWVAGRFPELMERHLQSIKILRERSDSRDGAIYFDLTGYDVEGYNKFIPYYLHPEATYSVGLSKSSFRTKVSVGSNPWAPVPPAVNLARLCERYGGGGHARVGAISFEPQQTELACRAATEIVQELRRAYRDSAGGS